MSEQDMSVLTEANIVELREDAFDSTKKLLLERRALGKKFMPSEGLAHAVYLTKAMVNVHELLSDEQNANPTTVEHAQFIVCMELENGSMLRQRLAKEKGFEFLKSDKATALVSSYTDL